MFFYRLLWMTRKYPVRSINNEKKRSCLSSVPHHTESKSRSSVSPVNNCVVNLSGIIFFRANGTNGPGLF